MDTQKVKQNVVAAAASIKANYKAILYAIGVFILMYGFIYVCTRQPQMPAEYKATIDSLTASNKVLIEMQKRLDSSIHTYETKVEKVDKQINTIKERTIIIKEYYHQQSQQIDHYDATQVDSFFKSRYDY